MGSYLHGIFPVIAIEIDIYSNKTVNVLGLVKILMAVTNSIEL